MTAFRWTDDPEFEGEPPTCWCGSATKALRVEPDRSESYMTHIFLCLGPEKHATPNFGVRALRKAQT